MGFKVKEIIVKESSTIKESKCPKCNGVLIKKYGKYGAFYGCSNYPNCNYIRPVKTKQDYVAEFVQKILNINIEDFLFSRNWNYPPSLYLRIFLEQCTNDDVAFINKQFTDQHLKDNRDSVQYALNLLLGWIIEEAIVKFFKINGYDIDLYGGDVKRDFLPYTSADADLVLKFKGKKFFIELITNYVGAWQTEHNIALRDNKYNKVIQKNTFILGIDFKTQQYIFVDPKNFYVQKEEYFIPWGKPASLLIIDDDNIFKNLSLLSNAFQILNHKV